MSKGDVVKFKNSQFLTAYEKEYRRRNKTFIVRRVDENEIYIYLPVVGEMVYTEQELEVI